MNERMYLYLCEDLTPGPTDHQPDEKLEPVVLAWAEGDEAGPRGGDRGRQDPPGPDDLRPAAGRGLTGARASVVQAGGAGGSGPSACSMKMVAGSSPARAAGISSSVLGRVHPRPGARPPGPWEVGVGEALGLLGPRPERPGLLGRPLQLGSEGRDPPVLAVGAAGPAWSEGRARKVWAQCLQLTRRPISSARAPPSLPQLGQRILIRAAVRCCSRIRSPAPGPTPATLGGPASIDAIRARS